ncbi:MAG: hypothetical protein ACO1RT_02820 [Planctomycetaceae bacterium]
MAHMSDDPAELSPQQRQCELVGILAAGFLRLRERRLLAGDRTAQSAEKPGESADDGLEDS